jgi:hypothetical protein
MGSGMLTGAFCRGGEAATASLVVAAEEIAVDLPLLHRLSSAFSASQRLVSDTSPKTVRR